MVRGTARNRRFFLFYHKRCALGKRVKAATLANIKAATLANIFPKFVDPDIILQLILFSGEGWIQEGDSPPLSHSPRIVFKCICVNTVLLLRLAAAV